MYTHQQRLSPLPRRVVPCLWEDLSSFLSRSAHEMQYETVTWVTQPENSPHRIATPELILLTEQADYLFLSALLLLSEEALYSMTLHRFSALFKQLDLFPVIKATSYGDQDRLLQPKQTPYHAPIQRPRLERGLLQNFFLPNLTTQICPFCLQENIAYDRLYWKNRYLLTCQKHAVLLLRRCSTCHKPIPSHRLQPTACPFCHRHYHSDSSLPISIPPEASCLLDGDALTLCTLGITPPLVQHDDPRAPLPPQEYMALMRAICISLRPLQTSTFQMFLPPALSTFLLTHTLHYSHSDRVPPLQVATAHWLFADWPTHFFSFLDALRKESGHARKYHAFSSPLLAGRQRISCPLPRVESVPAV